MDKAVTIYCTDEGGILIAEVHPDVLAKYEVYKDLPLLDYRAFCFGSLPKSVSVYTAFQDGGKVAVTLVTVTARDGQIETDHFVAGRKEVCGLIEDKLTAILL